MDLPESDHPLSSSSASSPPPPPPPLPIDEIGAQALLVSDASSFHPLSLTSFRDEDDPLLSSPSSSPYPIPNPNLSPSISSSSSSSFPDAHSYADVVPSAFYSKITVASPHKEEETSSSLVGSTTYVTYMITTKSAIDGMEFYVRRRFRDVVTLADRLAEAYRGFFIPARPDKSMMESQLMQKKDFVEQRRSAIEKYLRRLTAHPVIGRSDELRVFLQAQGKMPLPVSVDVASRVVEGAARLPSQLFGGESRVGSLEDVVQPARGGRDLLRMFRELKQSVVNDWGGMKPAMVEEDKEFLEKKDKLKELEQQLTTASQQAEALVKAQQDIGETMGELGLMFIKLSKFEIGEAIYNSQKVRASDFRNFGTAVIKASRSYRELNAETVKSLEILHEYLGLILAVHHAFSDRSSALLTVQTLMSDLSSLHAKGEKLETSLSKVFGGDKSRIRKIEELKETIRTTEDAKNVALRHYERIKENNRSELERFDSDRRLGFFGMMKAFVVNQVGYAEKITSVWENVVEDTRVYAKVE